MEKRICLTDEEAKLRRLLLDVSSYIGTVEGCTKPELRFTGGWVRDKLLGSESNDIDIGIDNMTGYRFGTLMKEYLEQPETAAKWKQDDLRSLAKIKANPDKSKHLETVTTKILKLDIDLVNLRKETYVENSRNPTMEFGTPVEDALRRDATVNALFYNLSTTEIEDFTGRGLQDMDHKVIKTPLAPLKTFNDDPLRVLRGIRFASRLGYSIAPEDENAMKDSSIQDALRIKISRERVGVELTKMLKGPDPHAALCSIDRLGLYNAVFTDPTDPDCRMVSTETWHRAYDELLEIMKARSEGQDSLSSLYTINSILLRLSQTTNLKNVSADNAPRGKAPLEDTFLAWLLTCFVPWAREVPKTSEKKSPPAPASCAAREGIKADKQIFRVVAEAVSYLPEIIAMKNAFCAYENLTTSPLKRKQSAVSREDQGQAIRRWGSHWRSSVMYALLVEIAESETQIDLRNILDGYAAWLSNLKVLDLLDVNNLNSIVKGDQLLEALGQNIKKGPWMAKAMEIAMEWQLRNPDRTDPTGAIAEVKARKEELGIP